MKTNKTVDIGSMSTKELNDLVLLTDDIITNMKLTESEKVYYQKNLDVCMEELEYRTRIQ